MAAKKLWSGRFAGSTNKSVEDFSASLAFDHRLYRHDIQGSIAHCRMLARQKIIAEADARTIIKALKEIRREIEQGKLALDPAFEDIHMLIETRLIEKAGPAGGRLHTARSRNDQVALDVSLFLREALVEIIGLVHSAQQGLLDMAEQNIHTVMPGFTHLQHAQPVLFAHHLMAYCEMLGRDRSRLEACFGRVNRMPLGSGALAGTPHPIDREYVAGLLGYPAVTTNSMDAVSDRDSLIEFCSCGAIIMMHLSRFCEELVLWSTPEFEFIELADAFCTGSSIMPQKKNPDVPELIRGKTGRVYGNLMALLTVMKALPLAYNRDLQEDKPALFDTVATLTGCLRMVVLILPAIKVNRARMAAAAQRGFLTATDLADYLVGKGIPFRSAHEVIGRAVAYCLRTGKELEDLTVRELQQLNPAFESDALRCLTARSSIDSRTCTGATGTQAVRTALISSRAQLRLGQKFISRARKAVETAAALD